MEKNNNLKNEIIKEYNLKIYQDDRFFKYGLDSVELVKFIEDIEKNKNLSNKKIIDLCSGSGIIGLLIQRTFKLNEIYFLEKQENFVKLNELNAKENLNNVKYKVFNLDILNIDNDILGKMESSFDIITVNPPYKKYNSGIDSKNLEKTIAKKESEDFLEKLFEFSNKILKNNGKIYMVNRVDRIVDICYIARKYKLEPKILKIISNDKNIPKLILIQFVKNGGEFLKVLENKIIKK